MHHQGLAALAMAMLLGIGTAQAGDLTVGTSDQVTPDAQLLAFVGDLRALAGPARKSSIKKVEKLFAPSVSAFTRGLDPFQPWHRLDDIKSDFLVGTANVMVEQGEIPEGMKIPDYRIDAMQQLAALIPEGGTFGTLQEMPGAVCAPAAYSVDRKAAAKFAARFKLDPYSLRFFDTSVGLHTKPGSAGLSANLRPRTLLMFDFKPDLPKGWSYYETSEGTSGYLKDRDDSRGLSQHHVCFAKVKGKYRITGIFGYGL